MPSGVAQRIGKARAKGSDVLKQMAGWEPKVTLKRDGSFDVEYVRPKNTDDVYWDETTPGDGNLYLDGWSNPVVPDWDELGQQVESGEKGSSWIPTERWRAFMQLDTVKNAMDTEGQQEEFLKKTVMVLLGAQAFNAVLVAIALF